MWQTLPCCNIVMIICNIDQSYFPSKMLFGTTLLIFFLHLSSNWKGKHRQRANRHFDGAIQSHNLPKNVTAFASTNRKMSLYDLNKTIKNLDVLGRRPGLVVMWGDSCSEGCEFESQHHILNGHFFTFICCKNCYVVWKDENKWKRDQGGAT